MNQEAFDRCVRALEEKSRRNPSFYQLQVGLLATLGYAYIALILLVLLALLAILVLAIVYSHRVSAGMVKLIFLVLFPIFVIVQSLFVGFPKPEGIELKRDRVPHLFQLIDELSRSLAAPRFHRILLTSDFNASVRQRPRLGILGWQENYLMLGLPLMQALSPEQFKAVLAHEFGHLSGNHSRFSAWIYRQRHTWEQIWQQFHQNQQQESLFLFKGFFNWYYPFFNAYSFVLARSNEYEADRCAARLAGRDRVAEALLVSQVTGQKLEAEFWPQVYAQTEERPEPPNAPFAALGKFLASNNNLQQEQEWLQNSLSGETNNEDTHPCLRDRLQALGYSLNAELPAPVKQCAARQLLGSATVDLTRSLEREWRDRVRFQWRERYTYVQQLRTDLQLLNVRAELTVEEAWNRARWTLELDGEDAAIPLMEEVLQLQADFAPTNFVLGQIWLERYDERGVELIETAMANDSYYILKGCKMLTDFWLQMGNREKAEDCEQRAIEQERLLALAEQERLSLDRHERFDPHGLPADAIAKLKARLKDYSQIQEAYLVRKQVQYFPEKPCYVLGIVWKTKFWSHSPPNELENFPQRLHQEIDFIEVLGGYTVVFVFQCELLRLREVMKKIPGASIV